MKLWFRKISVVLITFMTLGLYIPPTYLETLADSDEVSPSDPKQNDVFSVSGFHQIEEISEDTLDSASLIHVLSEEAKEKTIAKLGPRIMKQVEADVMTIVLPSIEEVIAQLVEEADQETIPYYEITEHVASGYGEKIFHVYDKVAKIDVARFHVRRDNRPRDGYWFNFHYHLANDNFQEHYQLGEIYWDKNTPPKWMS